jgi:hypothetical protein
MITRNESNSISKAEAVRDQIYDYFSDACGEGNIAAEVFKSPPYSETIWVEVRVQEPVESDLALRAYATVTVVAREFHRFEQELTVVVNDSYRTKKYFSIIKFDRAEAAMVCRYLAGKDQQLVFRPQRCRIFPWQLWRPRNEATSQDLSEVLHSRLTAESGLSFALRTQIAEGTIDRLLLLSCPAAARDFLEALVEELCDPAGIAAHPCESRDHHDELAGGFPAIRQAWMRPGSYRAGEYLLASDFRLFSIIEPLFLIAIDQGWKLGYQINVLRQPVAREDLRWLKKQLVRMELQEAFPGSLYDLQRSIVDRLPETTYLLDEMVGCGHEQLWDYLTRGRRRVCAADEAIRILAISAHGRALRSSQGLDRDRLPVRDAPGIGSRGARCGFCEVQGDR